MSGTDVRSPRAAGVTRRCRELGALTPLTRPRCCWHNPANARARSPWWCRLVEAARAHFCSSFPSAALFQRTRSTPHLATHLPKAFSSRCCQRAAFAFCLVPAWRARGCSCFCVYPEAYRGLGGLQQLAASRRDPKIVDTRGRRRTEELFALAGACVPTRQGVHSRPWAPLQPLGTHLHGAVWGSLGSAGCPRACGHSHTSAGRRSALCSRGL